jgi:hypothetical protein
MNTYRVKLEVEAEVEAFDETDARDYVGDIFNIDDEIKKVNIIRITEKNK